MQECVWKPVFCFGRKQNAFDSSALFVAAGCVDRLNRDIVDVPSCELAGFYVADNGVCYTNSTMLVPAGFWNATLADEKYNLESRLPSEEYLL